VIRSGLVEARHPVSVAVVDHAGKLILISGADPDVPFFMRSAAKPFQAAVAQAAGAALCPEQMAVACGSHGGQPVHLAFVRAMLEEVGLGVEHLACPASWPLSPGAARRVAAAGSAAPQPIFHNCSGKHAGMLRACTAQGWPLEYTRQSHPLQQQVARFVTGVTGENGAPVGVDGCGVPSFRVTTVGLARAFSRLAADPDLAPVAQAMARFGSLTSDGDRAEARLTRWSHTAVKGGAQGCLGVAWFGGLGIGAKAWSGDLAAAVVAVVATMRRLGILPDYQHEMLTGVARPEVLGGGRPVGHLQMLEEAGS